MVSKIYRDLSTLAVLNSQHKNKDPSHIPHFAPYQKLFTWFAPFIFVKVTLSAED